MTSKKKSSVVLGATSRLLRKTLDEPCCSRSLNHESSPDVKDQNQVTSEIFPSVVNDSEQIDNHDIDDVKPKEGIHSASELIIMRI